MDKEDAYLSFEDLTANPASFSRIVNQANLFSISSAGMVSINPRVRALHISFRNIGSSSRTGASDSSPWLDVVDIATLALIARLYGSNHVPVTFLWPRSYHGKASRFQKVLNGLGFRDLFVDPTDHPSPWKNHISFDGFVDVHIFHNYVPFAWFDKSHFAFSEDTHPHLIRPNLAAKVEADLTRVLLDRGFAQEDSAKIFKDLIFKELAWNTVLHSHDGALNGVGLVGGQVQNEGEKGAQPVPYLSFCIADLGVGIPFRLGKSYLEEADTKKKYLDTDYSESTRVLAYSLDQSSTSKESHPSRYDFEAGRGLYLVTESLRERGSMGLRSQGGKVALEPLVSKETRSFLGMDIRLDDELRNYPLPGTQIVGRISQFQRQSARLTELRDDASTPVTTVVTVCDGNGLVSSCSSPEAAARVVQRIEIKERTILFDLGFGDQVKHLNYLVRSVNEQHPNSLQIYFNVASPTEPLSPLAGSIHRSSSSLPLVILVKSYSDCVALGVGRPQFEALKNRWGRQHPWLTRFDAPGRQNDDGSYTRLVLSIGDYLYLCQKANESYIASSFLSDGEASGCYSGKIHLLGAQEPKPRFFSIAKNVQGSQENLQRWSVSGVAAIETLLQQSEEAIDSSLVILGYAGTVRPIISELVRTLGSRRARLYTLLTFDVPTPEELRVNIKEGDKVVLLTDVVSTGTLTESVLYCVEKVGAVCIGVVSLVVGRFAKGRSPVREFVSTFGSKPMITTADISALKVRADQLSLGNREYWVDPVSLIPVSKPVWGWAYVIDERIRFTLDLIVKTGAARCGHIVDGARHTAVFVKFKDLFNEDGSSLVFERTREECEKRLAQVGWEDFVPKCVMYPRGISRIERLESGVGASSTYVYQTGVHYLIRILEGLWPQSSDRLEVPRAFDPGGGARCASHIETVEEVSEDLIIADDGYWRGTTSRELIELAVSLGARRILIVTLLNRVSPKELKYLEGQRVVYSAEGSEATICYCFPLLLPVPYTGANESAYELTRRRLLDWSQSTPPIRSIALRLRDELTGLHPDDAQQTTKEYANAWVWARALAELASESEAALEQLKDLIGRSESDLHNEAILRLFLEEWPLLGKGRLRQTIAPKVKNKAFEVVANYAGNTRLIVNAVALVRSIFPGDFVSLLQSLPAEFYKKPNARFFERLTFQLLTLDSEHADPQRLSQTIRMVCEHLVPNISRAKLISYDQWQSVLSQLRSIRLQVELSDQQFDTDNMPISQVAGQTLILLRDNETVHNARAIVDVMASIADQFSTGYDEQQIRHLLGEWDRKYESFLNTNLIPGLSRLSDPILRASSMSGYWVDRDKGRLQKDRVLANELALMSLSEFATALEILSTPDAKDAYIRTLTDAASALSNRILGKGSWVIKVLESLQECSIQDFVEAFHAKLEDRLKPVVDDLRWIPPGDDQLGAATRRIFAPSHLIDVLHENIVDNLRRYAFAASGERTLPPSIALKLTIKDKSTGFSLICTFLNNGIPLTDATVLGIGGTSVNEDLRIYGGRLSPVTTADEVGYTVCQRVELEVL